MVQLGGRTIRIRQLARDLGMTPAYLSKILSGKRDIDSVHVGLIRRMTALMGFESMESLLHAVKVRREALGLGVSSGVSDEPEGATVEPASHRGPLSSTV